MGADYCFRQLDVARVTHDHGPLCVLVDGEGDIGGRDVATLGRHDRVRGAVYLTIVHHPLDLRGGIRVVGGAGYGNLFLGLGLGRSVQMHADR